MCGIGAIILKKDIEPERKKDMLNNMFLALEVRGSDASGILAINKNGKPFIYKQPVKASIFIRTVEYRKFLERHLKDNTFVVHTRAKTTGDAKNNNNNHPLEGERYVVVHNGVVGLNIDGLLKQINKDKYKEKDLEVDTFGIVLLLDQYGEQGLSTLDRSNAVIAYDKKEKKLVLWRNEKELLVGYDDGMFAAASNQNALDGVFNKRKMFCNIVAEVDYNKNYYHSDMEEGIAFKSDLGDIYFNREEIYHRAKLIETIVDKFRSAFVVELNGVFFIKFTYDLQGKGKKAMKATFKKYNEYWVVKDKEMKGFLEILKKYDDENDKTYTTGYSNNSNKDNKDNVVGKYFG